MEYSFNYNRREEENLKENNKIVIWIDKNNDKKENKEYLDIYSDVLKDFSFILVTSVNDGYIKLSKFSFQLVYVILSGRLAEEFLDLYEENLQQFDIITLNIIFCYNSELHKSKKYANDPFYNPGGVVTDFKEVIKFLKKDIRYPAINEEYSIENSYDNPFQFIFLEENMNNNIENDTEEKMDKFIEKISLPLILTKFSSNFINEEDLEKFKRFLVNNYSKELKGHKFYDILSSKIKIPYYLYAKIFVRLYSSESKFYRDLNLSLLNNRFSNFKQFIFVVYYGLNLKIIKSVSDKYLYRSALIDQRTYEKIKNSFKEYEENDNKFIILTKSFLSFSKSQSTASQFLKFSIQKAKMNNLKPILFKVNPLDANINVNVTNVEMKDLNIYAGEEEVIFLPFSGFEICDKPQEIGEYAVINLNYISRYEKQVIDYIDDKSKDKVDEFLQILISEDSLFKNIFSPESLRLFTNIQNKKNVLWIDQYCRCSIYDNYLTKFSNSLKDFYFEKATTIKEAYLVLSNHEFNLVYIIINDKLSRDFFQQYEENIKKLGVVTANIIFYDGKTEIKNEFINNQFLNPGKVVTDFSKVVAYLNTDECGFNNILSLKKTINNSFAGTTFGNIFKKENKNKIELPLKIIKQITSNLPNKDSITEFQKFVYKYGKKSLSKAVNPSLEKKIDLPLYAYPKFYMKLYGLNTDFYKDMNKYLSNRENNFGIYDTFSKILFYGLEENILISYDGYPLYRGGVIARKELESLEEDKFYSCKPFFSFSKSLKKSNEFLNKNIESVKKSNNSLYLARFIIEKYEKIKIGENYSNFISNAEMRHYSSFAKEKEVLFFPLSTFRIIKIIDSTYKNNLLKLIRLHYVGMISK